MIVKLIGTITRIYDRKSGVSKTGNNWESQAYMLEETNPNIQYPDKISFTVFGREAIEFYNFQLGQTVSVDCVLSSNEFNGNAYTNLRAIPPATAQRAQTFTQPQAQQQPRPQQQYYQQPVQQQAPQPQPQAQAQGTNAADLPF